MPDAERLGEDQCVARTSFRIASERLRRNEADDGEAVDRLGRIDGMTTGHGNSGLRRHCRAAAQNFADHGGRHAVDRHAENGEREDRFAAHRVDVGERVGRSDAAEVERIVDHRHEEVGGRDDAGLVVEPPDCGVVARLRPDEQIGERRAAGWSTRSSRNTPGDSLQPQPPPWARAVRRRTGAFIGGQSLQSQSGSSRVRPQPAQG